MRGQDYVRLKLFQQTGELLAKEGGLILPMFVKEGLTEPRAIRSLPAAGNRPGTQITTA